MILSGDSRMYKKWVLMVFAVFLFLPIAYGSGYFTVGSHSVKDRIMINEVAKFTLTIENYQDFDDSFRVYYTGVEWDFSTEPRTDSTVYIKKGEKKNVSVVLRPLHVGYGSHGVIINVRAVKGDRLAKHSVLVNIISLGLWQRGYPIAIRTEVDMPQQIDPRVKQKIKIDIENQYAVNVTGLSVRLSSNVFREEKIISLEPLGKKSVEFIVELERDQKPLKDILYITFNADNHTFKEIDREFEVIAYAELRKELLASKKEFLRNYKEIRITNDGNSKTAESVMEDAPLFTFLYSFTKPGAGITRENGKNYYVWNIALEPGESVLIRINESYWPVLSVIIIGGMAVLMYYILRSPIVVRKEAKEIVAEEGGISQIRLVLHIKNRTPTKLTELVVSERIPNIAEIIKKFRIGSLQPTKVLQHEKKGSIVKWEIEEIEPFEERMIAYSLRTKLTVLGSLKLPSALAKFKTAGGRYRVTSSNELMIHS